MDEALKDYAEARVHEEHLPGLLRRWAGALLRSGGHPLSMPIEELIALVQGLPKRLLPNAVPFALLAQGRNRTAWRDLLRMLDGLPPEVRVPVVRRAMQRRLSSFANH